jgi:hypothetical protein
MSPSIVKGERPRRLQVDKACLITTICDGTIRIGDSMIKRLALGVAASAAMVLGALGVTGVAQAQPPGPPGAHWSGSHWHCWYASGWHGPGWYWCGYRWRSGNGWGGGAGWNGWVVGGVPGPGPGGPPGPGPGGRWFNGHQHCWYGNGWHGAGWYWCGSQWSRGVGWGGPRGWNGWSVSVNIP